MNISIGDIEPIETPQRLARASTDPPLFHNLESSRIDPRKRAQRETQTSIPMQALEPAGLPIWEDAKPCKPAGEEHRTRNV